MIDGVFKALSDPTRREILRMLREGDMSAGEISDRFSVAKSTISGHLNVLRQADLIVSERHGTTIVYSLNVAVYEEMVATIMGLLGVGKEERELARWARRSAKEARKELREDD